MTSEPLEYLLMSWQCSDAWSTSIINAQSGVSVWSFKGTELNDVAAKTVAPVANEFLMFLSDGKPVANLISLQNRERIHQRSILPAVASCLAVSPDGSVCCMGIEEKIYTWMTDSGQLVTIVKGHYQPISKLAFTDDSWVLVSAGKDGLVQCWNVADLLRPHDPGVSRPEPLRKWDAHGLEVTGLFLTTGGLKSRICTCSKDQTLKVHSMSGACILTLMFDCAVTACCMDGGETRIFAGTSKGIICQINLFIEPFNPNQHVSTVGSVEEYPIFKGHTKPVTAISCNYDSSLLASGDSESVRIWHISSKQNLKTIPTKGPVTTLQFILSWPVLTDPDYKAKTITKVLQKQLCSRLDSNFTVRLGQNSVENTKSLEDIIKNIFSELEAINSKPLGSPDIPEYLPESSNKPVSSASEKTDLETVQALQKELEQAKNVNRELYHFIVNRILDK